MKQPTHDKPTPTPSLKGRGERGADNQTSGSPTGANDSAFNGESGQPRGANAAKRQSFSEGAEREWEPYKYWDPFVERGDVEDSPEMDHASFS